VLQKYYTDLTLVGGYRLVSFESNNDDESWDDNLDFGESYYYIKYDCPMSTIGALTSASLHIIWVKVTIV
jgi:hypothetical protein